MGFTSGMAEGGGVGMEVGLAVVLGADSVVEVAMVRQVGVSNRNLRR